MLIWGLVVCLVEREDEDEEVGEEVEEVEEEVEEEEEGIMEEDPSLKRLKYILRR